MLQCPVRDCQLALVRDGRRLVCSKNHSFDVSRSGYINLLQPQERRSKTPGDTPAAVAGRRRIHDRGVTAPLLAAISQMAQPTTSDIVLDAGCGEGFYLGSLASQTAFDAHGADISIPAIDAAARRYPACEWIVTNADRALPYQPQSFSLILSITARMNPTEFQRVIRPGGRLLVAIPAPGDLIELRGAGRDRTARTIETFAQAFTLTAQTRITTAAELNPTALEDVLHSIYRPLSQNPPAMRVTFSLDLLHFLANS